MLGDQPCRPEEQAGKVRGDAALRVAQRRAVAKTNQREELVEFAVAVDGQKFLREIAERDGLILDDSGENDAHGEINFFTAAGAPPPGALTLMPRLG